jgi:hypothetical protein
MNVVSARLVDSLNERSSAHERGAKRKARSHAICDKLGQLFRFFPPHHSSGWVKILRRVSKGGALIAYEHLIDDDRRRNTAGLLMSLIMLLESQGGFDDTGADCCSWMRDVGFSETYVGQLTGIESMVVGIK